MFIAKSGTGKSTHTRLWREKFGFRAVMVNDDKPLVKITDKGARVYGTPYSGKEGLNTNISVPLKAICILERSERNRIERISFSEAFPMLIQQTYHPKNREMFSRTFSLLDRLRERLRFYRLHCNKGLEAAEISYKAMKV